MLYKRYEIGYNLLYVNCFGGHAMNTDFSRILTLLRKEKGISQKQLEELSGVKQPVIARMEKGYTSPQLDTILKLLLPLGKTLAIVPLGKPQKG